ncbi:hypothetical protein [Streptomyces sp. 029-5]|uniref:hypothetical protein n=1 Tax=Streptomyces sp. 029-5 TaxID=2789261 RepID=UPI0039805413
MNVKDPATDFSCHPASREERDEIVSVYRDSFDDDPVFQWLFPDRETRKPLLEEFFDVMVDHTFAHGGSVLTMDYGAVSMYFPPDAVEQPREIRDRLLDTLRRELGPQCDKPVHLLTMLEASHPRDLPPHYYGTFVAARPRHPPQEVSLRHGGQGPGRRLRGSVVTTQPGALRTPGPAPAGSRAHTPRRTTDLSHLAATPDPGRVKAGWARTLQDRRRDDRQP